MDCCPVSSSMPHVAASNMPERKAHRMDALSSALFEIEVTEDTLVVTPVTNLGEFDYARFRTRFEAEAESLLNLWETTDAKNLIIDFHRTDYFGSTALGFLVGLRKRVQSRKGEMVLCCLSDHETEILAVTKLGKMWSICPSREEALQLIGG